MRCVQGNTLTTAKTILFDGENWEENIKDLRDIT